MRLLDLFCGAGLAADGYASVGFEVVGVDINPQPNYPYEFHQGDAMAWWGRGEARKFDAIHASPPCQLFTRAKHLRDAQGGRSKELVDLLTPTLDILNNFYRNIPWVVENVENARPLMSGAVRLCGSAFHLQVQRHRLFASNVPLRGTDCHHERFPLDPVTGKPRPWGVYHVPGDSIPKGGRTARDAEHAREVMGARRSLPWASIKEGFPPAYTAHVGADILMATAWSAAA